MTTGAEGGLFWSTYKAICRREGVFKNGQGSHDWNAQLTEPMIKLIAPGWEKVFSRKIQSVMNNFTQMVPAVLKKFHRDIEDRARKVGTSVAQLSILTQQVRLCEQSIKDLAGEIQRVIIARQKDINREFVPVIQRAMDPSYAWCDAEVGAGQFKRMKAHMTEHVERNRQTMFQASADEVQRQLKAMVHDVEELLADKIDSVFMAVKRDYGNLLGGGVPQGQVLPRLQRQVRREINKTIDGVERVMQKIIGVEVEASDDEVGTEEDEDGVSELGHDGKEAATTDGHGQGSAASDVKHVSTETAPKLQSANSTVNGPGVEGAHVQSMNGAVEEEHSADDANSVDDGNVEEEEADGEIQLDDA